MDLAASRKSYGCAAALYLKWHAIACEGYVLAPGGAKVAELSGARKCLWTTQIRPRALWSAAECCDRA